MQIPFIGRFYESAAVAPVPPARRLKLGLALGAGAARGWSHLGVLMELADHGLQPDVIAGASVGAVVAGCYAAGKLAELEHFVRSLTPRRVFSLMDLSFSGAGLLGGGRLKASLDQHLGNTLIEDLPLAFGAVATECVSGQEVWLTKGPLGEAVRASYALPGIFEPVKVGGRWLFDGALVNPVPVTLCRALGADLVIAVNLVPDSLGRADIAEDVGTSKFDTQVQSTLASDAKSGRGLFRSQFTPRGGGAPSIATAMLDAFNITQDRIARSRLAGDPPDVMIKARVGKIGLFDFHRADELIAIGRESVVRSLEEIQFEIGSLTRNAQGN